MNTPVSYAMEQFFGGYFHPDWDLHAADWPQIVDSFVVDEKPEHLRSLAHDIDEFRRDRAESQLHEAMLKMGGYYDPRPEMTYREWLGMVAERLRGQPGRASDIAGA
mgnify:FL=1